MFFLKKLVSAFLLPINLSLALLLVGLVLLLGTSRQRAGKLLVSAGALVLFLVSFNPLVDLWVDPLERWYSPLTDQELADLRAGRRGPAPRWVVVLGGGYTEDPGLPVSSWLSETSLARLVEGVRLQRVLPQTRIILAVGAAGQPEPVTRLVESLGVARERIILETQADDTGGQARILSSLLGRDAFILVTSAVHLPRAMILFQRQGLNPIPQPAAYLGSGRGPFGIYRYCPNTFGLIRSERACHEYLGLAWNWLGGK